MPTTMTDRLSASATSTSDPLAAYGFTGLAVLGPADETELASAATVDLLGSASLANNITGGATITSLGSTAKRIKFARFTGSAMLTHNATNLILPGGADVIAAAGDTMLVVSDDDGNARVVVYQRADGTALIGMLASDYDPGGIAEQVVGLTATQALSNKTLASPVLNGDVSGSAILDEDDLATDSATRLATQQSIKAYVDANVVTASYSLPPGHLFGCVLSQDMDADHDINVTAGSARDAADDADLALASEITKRIDATWSAGDDAGGLSSSLSAPAADTWYHVFLIAVSGAVDVGFDTDADAANLIADHSATAHRRLGSVLTDGSANLIGFTQSDDLFEWHDPPLDVQVTDQGNSAVMRTLSVPPADGITAIMNIMSYSSSIAELYVSSPNADDEQPVSSGAAPLATIRFISTSQGGIVGNVRVKTNTSGQVRTRSYDASTWVQIATMGWFDNRGRMS